MHWDVHISRLPDCKYFKGMRMFLEKKKSAEGKYALRRKWLALLTVTLNENIETETCKLSLGIDFYQWSYQG